MSETKATNQVGIIGQMYEERKSKKLGVLESREEKYKTLMMRDPEGKSFNITYSTFKSNWRKYQGEEVVQTSTQVEEAKAEEVKQKKEVKKTVEKAVEAKSDEAPVHKLTTEEKIKQIRALDTLIEGKIKDNGYDLKTTRVSKGGIVIRFKKYKLFEAWIKYATGTFEFVLRDEMVNLDKKVLDSVIKATKSEYVFKESWVLKHLYKVPADGYDTVLDTLLELANKYAEQNPDKGKQKNEKTDKKEKK